MYELESSMTYEELLKWFDYFDRRPPEWRASDRTVKLIRAQGAKGNPWDFFPELYKIYHPKTEKLLPGQISGSNLKSSAFFEKLRLAVNGDKLDL
jgi:hypothetical protein